MAETKPPIKGLKDKFQKTEQDEEPEKREKR